MDVQPLLYVKFLKHFSLEPSTERYLSESTFAHPDGQHRQANALPEHSSLFKPDSNGVNTWIPIIYEKRLLKIQFLSVSQVSVGTVRWKWRKSGHLCNTWRRLEGGFIIKTAHKNQL